MPQSPQAPRFLLDTSVLVASLDAAEPQHTACDALVAIGGHAVLTHALAETFSVLTGGRLGRRLKPADASALIADSLLPYLKPLTLTPRDTVALLAECAARGARGGAVYDALHLAAARKAGVEALVTLDVADFEALWIAGDPPIRPP